VRRRKCLTPAPTPVAPASASASMDVAAEAGELLPGGGGGGGVAALSGGGSSDNNGDADGTGYGKSLCAGKDIQTAECRGEQCQIGKDGKCVYDNNRKSVSQTVGNKVDS